MRLSERGGSRSFRRRRKKPSYEMPQMPALPLLLGTLWSSQSMVS